MNKARYTLAMWCCVTPLVLLLSRLMELTLPQADSLTRTLLLTSVLVPAMVHGIAPLLQRVFLSRPVVAEVEKKGGLEELKKTNRV